MLSKDNCIILPFRAIQVQDCSLGTNITDACTICTIDGCYCDLAEGLTAQIPKTFRNLTFVDRHAALVLPTSNVNRTHLQKIG